MIKVNIDNNKLMEKVIDAGVFDCSSNFREFKLNFKNEFGFIIDEKLIRNIWESYLEYSK